MRTFFTDVRLTLSFVSGVLWHQLPHALLSGLLALGLSACAAAAGPGRWVHPPRRHLYPKTLEEAQEWSGRTRARRYYPARTP